MTNIAMRMVLTSAVTAAVLGSGIALAPDASAAVSSTMSTKAYNFAMNQRGDDYVKGATGFSSYDCSGLIWRSYQQAGKSWKRYNANDQRRYQTIDITASQARKGDLVFFEKDGDGDRIYDHVGIYAGSGYMVDAQTSTYYGPGVIKEKISGYWSSHYTVDFRRVK